ncbi:MAG: DUF1700 domain-containing protein [bacterium]|nr:DUF1700 domain-containing protein [bacterium]
MDKQEFMTLLAETLRGEVPPNVIQENLQYYRQYLSEEEAKGRDSQEILRELGDPRLLAKTIIDACPESAENQGMEGYEGAVYEERRSTRESTEGGQAYEEPKASSHWHYIDLSKWYWKLAGLLLVLAVIWLVLTVVGGISLLLVRFAWPLLILWMIYVFIKSRRK